jgi:ribonuclease G
MGDETELKNPSEDEQSVDKAPNKEIEKDIEEVDPNPSLEEPDEAKPSDAFEMNDDWPILTFPEPQEASLIISADDHETRVAYLIDDMPTEFFFDRSQDVTLVGNIYKGRVVRVLPGMQAAFVDIGLKQAAFLYVDDIADEQNRPTSMRNSSPMAATMMESTFTQTIDIETGRSIQQLLQEGQELMVQVSKDPISTKGARVTNHISIAGRHLVYIPLVEHIGVSRRITNEEERHRLKEILTELIPQGGGFVARTAAEGCSIEDLREDLNYLRQVWNDVLTRMESLTAPATLYEDLDLPLKATRDLVTPRLKEIVVDHPSLYQRLHSFMERFMPEYLDRVRLYDSHEPLYEAYGIEAELNRALSRQVWLPSGGYLVIDQTEAFTAIDVNSGRFVGKFHFEETIYRTNIEAIHEVVHQLQLRNLGGIIILDLIDMERSSMRHSVYTAFLDALKRDRAKTNISKISGFGLIEMTRTRVRDSLLRSVCEPCFYCQGTGFLKSAQTITHNIYREIIQDEMSSGEVLVIEAHPSITQYFQEVAQALVTDLESRLDLTLHLHANAALHLERYRFYYQ